MATLTAAIPNNWKLGTLESHFADVKKVIGEMRDRIEEDLTLEDLAEIALMSPFHFNRVFHGVTGVPPCRFMWMIRIDMAKQLLATTALNVIEICYRVGYNSLGTFTRRFTQLVGMPPTHFRKMVSSKTMKWMNFVRDVALLKNHKNPNGSVKGLVEALPEFQGLVVVGLFNHSLPQNAPVSCALISDGGDFLLPEPPNGKYYLYAAGICCSDDPLDYLLGERIQRGTSAGIIAFKDECVYGDMSVELRPMRETDPPILACLPRMIQQELELSKEPA